MKTVYSNEKMFRRMLNHILQLGEISINHTEWSTNIEITANDREGGYVGYLVVDINSKETLIYLKLSDWAARKYADLDD